MISSAASFATTLGHVASRKSRATSVLQVGVKRFIAFPVQLPTSLCATAFRLQNVRSQTSNDTMLLLSAAVDPPVNALAAPAAPIPPMLSPWMMS